MTYFVPEIGWLRNDYLVGLGGEPPAGNLTTDMLANQVILAHTAPLASFHFVCTGPFTLHLQLILRTVGLDWLRIVFKTAIKRGRWQNNMFT